MAIGGIDETVIERWLLDADQYRGEIKSVAGELRKQQAAARDAAAVQEKLAAEMEKSRTVAQRVRAAFSDAASSTASLKSVGDTLSGSYLSISQGIRDTLGVAKKLDNWLRDSSPEWKSLSDELRASATQLGRFVGESTLAQGALQGVVGIVDRAATAVAAFTGNLDKVPYQKLADMLALVAKVFPEAGLTRDVQQAMLTPFVASQQQAAERAAMWGAEGPGTEEKAKPKRRGGRGGLDLTVQAGGVLKAGEQQIAAELRAQQTAANTNAIDMEIAADERWFRMEQRKEQAFQRELKAQKAINDQREKAISVGKELGAQARQYNDDLRGLAEGGLAQFGAGLWAAVDAAVQGKASFGEAMAAMAKSVLMSIAAQASGEAVLELGRGLAASAAAFFNPALAGKAALHYAAAGVFGGIGAVTGLAGIGLGMATGGGGAGRSAGGGAASGFRTSDRMGSASSFGEKRRREDTQPIIVEVYMGDRSNRAAAMQLEKQLSARIRKAS